MNMQQSGWWNSGAGAAVVQATARAEARPWAAQPGLARAARSGPSKVAVSGRTIRPGDFFDPGDAGADATLMLESGALLVEIVTLSGVELYLDRLGPGDPVVGLGAISNPAFVVGYRAAGLVRLVERPSVAVPPEAAVKFWQNLLAAAVRLTHEVACLQTSHRLYCELLRLEARRRAAGEAFLRMPTQAALAQRLCTSRETVSRELAFLRRQGVISSGQDVAVVSPDYLLSKVASALDLSREDDVWASIGAYCAP